MQTAEIIGRALQVKVKTLDNLRNLDQGLWQGMLVDEVKVKQPKVYRQWQEHPENVCPPNGEMLSEAAERIDEAIDKLAKKHRTGNLGLVVPEPLATLVAKRLCGGDLGDLWKAHNGCNCCQEFELQPTGRRADVSFVSNGQASGANGKA